MGPRRGVAAGVAVDAVSCYHRHMKKTCTGCELTLDLDSFRANARGKHGRHSRCRECERKARKEQEGSPARKASYARYARSAKGKERNRRAKRRYRESGKARETYGRYYRRRRWYMLCKSAVNNRVADGKMRAASEVECEAGPDGCEGAHHWHHDSYQREHWLVVRCLCAHHHREWHKSNSPIPYTEP